MKQEQLDQIKAFSLKQADEILNVANMMGWNNAGQLIVYGLERSIGFLPATDLCAAVQRVWKRKKDRNVEKIAATIETFLIDLVQKAQAKKGELNQ
jgi:hypothetical protein